MRDAYADQLDSIRDDLVLMARLVREAVSEGTAALLEGDAHGAEEVIRNDVNIDNLRVKLEELRFELLSLQNPVAGDLRMLVASLRMVSEFERMGDLAVHVAKIARLRIPEVAVPDPLVPTIARMAAVAEVMIGKVEH
ncbi:MAG: PhoU domain-containing protein, partial [Marmoricola sp.]